MKIILDTNALLWILDSNEKESKIGSKSKQAISDADIVYVSAVSILELRIKKMLGKIEFPDNIVNIIEQSGLNFLSISPEHADSLKNFDKLSRHDPFDRILLAQSDCEKAKLLTSDRLLLDLVPRLTLDVTK